jgi:hypothetical protein
MGKNNLLIEALEWVPYIYEGKGGATNIRFAFAQADQPNRNRRIYPLKVLSASVAAAQNKIAEGASLYGSCDHKTEMSVNDVSHRLLSVRMQEKNAIAEAAILNTDRGKNLQEILKSGGSVGVSMRGTGTTKPLAEGLMEVCEDHVLLGVDVVLQPSFDATISAANIFESANFTTEIDPRTLFALYKEALAAGRKESFAAFSENFKNRRK